MRGHPHPVLPPAMAGTGRQRPYRLPTKERTSASQEATRAPGRSCSVAVALQSDSSSKSSTVTCRRAEHRQALAVAWVSAVECGCSRAGGKGACRLQAGSGVCCGWDDASSPTHTRPHLLAGLAVARHRAKHVVRGAAAGGPAKMHQRRRGLAAALGLHARADGGVEGGVRVRQAGDGAWALRAGRECKRQASCRQYKCRHSP